MSSTASMAKSIFLERRIISVPPSSAGRAEAAGAAPALGQRSNLVEDDAADRRDDELGDALAALEDYGLAAEIGQDDVDLAAIVGVDRAWAVEHSDAVLEGEARARPDLPLIALGQSERYAGRHRPALARGEGDVAAHRGGKVD